VRTERIPTASQCFDPVLLPVEESGNIGYLLQEWPAQVKSAVNTANDRLKRCKVEWGTDKDGEQE
jgi:hypothetical protein